jgi:hypothetical protein
LALNTEINLVFRVRIHTRVGSDGKLDFAASSAVSLDDFRFTLKNTDMDLGKDDENLDNIWEGAPLTEYGQVSIQHKSGLSRGRILIVSGNCLIDASGGSSSSSLGRIVQKVLSYTTIDKTFSLDIPDVTRRVFHLPPVKDGRDNIVKGIGTSFTVSRTVSALVAAASAKVEDLGLLVDGDTIESDRSQGTSVVKFTFITRTLGLHDVNLEFASAPAMTLTTKNKSRSLRADWAVLVCSRLSRDYGRLVGVSVEGPSFRVSIVLVSNVLCWTIFFSCYTLFYCCFKLYMDGSPKMAIPLTVAG